MFAILFDRFERERRTIKVMTEVYCSGLHVRNSDTPSLCGNCQELLDYAFLRLSKCPFGDTKPTCVKCVVHCYKAAMRERVKDMMRYSGPKMITRHPVLAVFHLIDSRLYKPRRKANPAVTVKPAKNVQNLAENQG